MPPTPLNWFLVLNFKSGSARGSVQVSIQPELPSGLRLEPIRLTQYFEKGFSKITYGCGVVNTHMIPALPRITDMSDDNTNANLVSIPLV